MGLCNHTKRQKNGRREARRPHEPLLAPSADFYEHVGSFEPDFDSAMLDADAEVARSRADLDYEPPTDVLDRLALEAEEDLDDSPPPNQPPPETPLKEIDQALLHAMQDMLGVDGARFALRFDVGVTLKTLVDQIAVEPPEKSTKAYHPTGPVQDDGREVPLGDLSFPKLLFPFTRKHKFMLAREVMANAHESANTFNRKLKGGIYAGGQTGDFRSHHEMKTYVLNMEEYKQLPPWQGQRVEWHHDWQFHKRDPLALIRTVFAYPHHREHLTYCPYREYRTGDGDAKQRQLFSGLANCEWWWEMQSTVPPGGMVVPIILGSDKTMLSSISGNKSSWPVYMAVGNLDEKTRRARKGLGFLLLGLMPKFERGMPRADSTHVFHMAMRALLQPLVDVWEVGFDILCADGVTRRGFPRIPFWMADYPEHVLLTGTVSGRCTTCACPKGQLGTWHKGWPLRKPEDGATEESRKAVGLHKHTNFLRGVPYLNVHQLQAPDRLHQLLVGMLKHHMVAWVGKYIIAKLKRTRGLSKEKARNYIEARMRMVPKVFNFRGWDGDFLSDKQKTGHEYKEVRDAWLAGLAPFFSTASAADAQVLNCMRALTEFILLAGYESHDRATLLLMEKALLKLHANKDVFRPYRVHANGVSDFEIPKLHALLHYVMWILRMGPAGGSDTEQTEAMHARDIKPAYKTSNGVDFEKQMLLTLQMRDAFRLRDGRILHQAAASKSGTEEEQKETLELVNAVYADHLLQEPEHKAQPCTVMNMRRGQRMKWGGLSKACADRAQAFGLVVTPETLLAAFENFLVVESGQGLIARQTWEDITRELRLGDTQDPQAAFATWLSSTQKFSVGTGLKLWVATHKDGSVFESIIAHCDGKKMDWVQLYETEPQDRNVDALNGTKAGRLLMTFFWYERFVGQGGKRATRVHELALLHVGKHTPAPDKVTGLIKLSLNRVVPELWLMSVRSGVLDVLHVVPRWLPAGEGVVHARDRQPGIDFDINPYWRPEAYNTLYSWTDKDAEKADVEVAFASEEAGTIADGDVLVEGAEDPDMLEYNYYQDGYVDSGDEDE